MLIMAKKQKFTEPFSAALDHYMLMNRYTNDEFGRLVKYSGAMIDAIRHERSQGIENKRREIARRLGFDNYDLFLQEGKRLIQAQTKQFPTEQQSMRTDNNIVNIDRQHWKVVEQFQQKDTALQINQALVELEKVDPSSLESMLEMVLDRLDRKKREAAKKREAGNDKT